MGVTGLWTVLQPCARPIKIETLNKKRLAVDASIWIYQFLKAVRDKEGHALRNSHIVGFFRRICKLLFIGIKPVFVFDGGAPTLKRQTISNRKQRREGRREDAVRTAGKLLAVQMQRAAEEENRKRKEARQRPRDEPEEEIPENVVYAEEIFQTPQERQQNRTFKKKDAYHLPELDVSLSAMGGANDPRIMSMEELEEYARQFDRGEDINVYDFSKIDFDSPFFTSLPAADRYNILNAARLRSRLRMGYSKEQLDTMFPDRMAFSKFQIERVRERNELTQRLMNINGMVEDNMFGAKGVARVAGDKAREYVLVKNDGVEGGWVLGVITNEGQREKPIDVDKPTAPDDDDWESDEEFEDVPIEGLNRLPKPNPVDGRDVLSRELAKRRQQLYASRKERAPKPKPEKQILANEDPDSLFIANDEDKYEDITVDEADDVVQDGITYRGDKEEEEQLQRAIALSLQQGGEVEAPNKAPSANDNENDDYHEVFPQEKVEENYAPFAAARGTGLAIARMANQRSTKIIPRVPFEDSESDEEDFQTALRNSSKQNPRPVLEPTISQVSSAPVAPDKLTASLGFDGPLPFEKLNLGNSILGKKKMQTAEEANAGGFVRDLGEQEEKDPPTPIPPWFCGERDIVREIKDQNELAMQEQKQDAPTGEPDFIFEQAPRTRQNPAKEVIDLEALPDVESSEKVMINIESSEDKDDMEMEDVIIEDPKLRMGDLADQVRAEPPKPLSEGQLSPPLQDHPLAESTSFHDPDNAPIDWSESEPENQRPPKEKRPAQQPSEPSKSPSPEFEDVMIGPPPGLSPSPEPEIVSMKRWPSEGVDASPHVPLSGTANDNGALEIAYDEDDEDQFSDPEDAELFKSLAAEAEEHARFASSLSGAAALVDFDAELKQLRTQQKKDRRDADEVTQTMISECQHLLRLFGLPYITAPMEAEAQCAELLRLGLVDGIVTDDSDTFLFGGSRVYKNMFNSNKFVECYLASDLEKEFSLTRDKMISIAQLLGSDYTTGIPGIGPVKALEILGEFGDIAAFKEWWTEVQAQPPTKANIDAETSPWRRRFRRSQAAKLFLPVVFPDPRVADAYLNPVVDADPQSFVWGVPDLDALRTFLSNQIGWSTERTDEVLVPVVRDMNRREKEGTQSNITRFFDGAVGAGAIAPPRIVKDRNKGKRLGAALGRLRDREKERSGDMDGDEIGNANRDGDEDGEGIATTKKTSSKKTRGAGKRKKPSKNGTADEASDNFSEGHGSDVDDDDDDDLYSAPPRKKKPRKVAKS